MANNNSYPTPTQTVLPSNGIKTIRLQDGTVIQKNFKKLTVHSSRGTSEIQPAPIWFPQNEFRIPEYVTKKGHVNKLAYDRYLGSDHWCERYLVLDGPIVHWYRQSTDQAPRGSIRLVAGGWVKAADHNSPKRKDAQEPAGAFTMMTMSFSELSSENRGQVGRDNCFALHRPRNVIQDLSEIIDANIFSLMFSSNAIKNMNPRTFYFQCNSANERNEWVEAIYNNLQHYLSSEECFQATVKQYCDLLRNCGVENPELWDWKPLLNELYSD